MALRDGVLLLMAIMPGLAEDTVAEWLIDFMRNGTSPTAQTATTVVESAQVLVTPDDASSAVAGTLALGETATAWRQRGSWWFVSTGSLAGWVHENWVSVA